MEQFERKLILVSIALMVVFAALAAYASIGIGIKLPTCEHMAPFSEGKVISKGNNQFEIHYVAKMWSFDPAELILPEKADVDVYLSALDVNHGFEVVGTDLNLMAVPGTVNASHQHFEHKGEYLVICHEYCGLNHQNMLGKIRVVSPAEYAKYLEEQAEELNEGQQLAAKYDCTTCHTTDGSEGIGPSFKGMFGRTETLADGKQVVVDDAYFVDSVHNPDLQVVKNFEPGNMPKGEMTDEELQDIIQFVKTLK